MIAVVDYRAGNVLDAVREWAPEGVDLVVDTVGLGTAGVPGGGVRTPRLGREWRRSQDGTRSQVC